ncbi:restriction modification system DNA specificity domain-containing protein [Mycoplasmopsis canis UFG1]|uniref:restriction endonuclease subunit S n=1 Tax=Mycoplasmopsis canis TaxID=29555 RepID=UPI00025B013F|nr:restriction endonuclease subunit S [Mycoplasmopsis canis]EIE41659.1 restriction modification system DNA specificity domain-containing protein [Mycoplasmopsis canis UFG1]
MKKSKIIKLKDIATFTPGQSPESKYYSDNKMFTPFLQGSRTFWRLFPEIHTYTSKITKIAKKGDILMSVRAPIGDLNLAPIDLCIGRGLGAIKGIDIPNEYIFFILKNNINNLIKNASGTTFSSVSVDEVLNMDLLVPIKNLKKIGDFLWKIESKIEINNKINDNLENHMFFIYDFQISKMNGKFVQSKDISYITNGKQDANFGSKNGKYNFFTCSTETLKCDDFAFDNSAILIAGNGGFNVNHYIGKFNSYHRSYVLLPNNPFFSILYLGSLNAAHKFSLNSNGSIIKFITPKDVVDIAFFISKNIKILNTLNNLIHLKENTINEIENLKRIKDFLLPLLINGQAEIDD